MADEPLQPLPTPAEVPVASVPPFEINRQALLWVAIIALVIAVFAGGYSYRQLGNVKRESARRLAELQQAVTTANDTANRADAEARAARQQAAVVEARLAEEQGQREALEQLYSDLSRGRDEAVLVEVERLITVAAQELQLSGNVATALAALQTADARLSRSDNARFVPLRRVLARDIERLKGLPAIDFPAMSSRIDSLLAAVDTLPLAFDERAERSAASKEAAKASGFWSRLGAEVWGELKQLVTVRRMNAAEPPLLPPDQAYFVKQNLRLRLLNARLSLLARDEAGYREDLRAAQAWLREYFDVRSKPTADALAQLKQLSSATIAFEMPTISESLQAVRAFQARRERPVR